MRTKRTILDEANESSSTETRKLALLEVMCDIRDLLSQGKGEALAEISDPNP